MRTTAIIFYDTRDVVITFKTNPDEKQYIFAEKSFSKVVLADKISNIRTSTVDHRRNYFVDDRLLMFDSFVDGRLLMFSI